MAYAFQPYRAPAAANNAAASAFNAPLSQSTAAGAYYSPYYGGIPQLPSPVGSANTAVQGNLQNLPGILSLAGQVNSFNQGQLMQNYGQMIPGFQGLLGQRSGVIGQNLGGQLPGDIAGLQAQNLTNISGALRGQAPSDIAPIVATQLGNIRSQAGGQVPMDVLNNLRENAAESGAALGISGAPASAAAYNKALGLTSLDLQNNALRNLMTIMPLTQQGEQDRGLSNLLASFPLTQAGRQDAGLGQLNQAVGSTPVARQMDPMQFMVTPQEQQDAAASQAIYNAAPIPAYAAEARLGMERQGATQGYGNARYAPPNYGGYGAVYGAGPYGGWNPSMAAYGGFLPGGGGGSWGGLGPSDLAGAGITYGEGSMAPGVEFGQGTDMSLLEDQTLYDPFMYDTAGADLTGGYGLPDIYGG